MKNDIKTKANICVIHAYKKDQITIFVFIPEEKKMLIKYRQNLVVTIGSRTIAPWMIAPRTIAPSR